MEGIPLWFWLALLAGCMQTLRNTLARTLAPGVSPALNSWARFAFNLPWAAALVAFLSRGQDRALPGRFLVLCAATAVTQLLGNVALVAAFRRSHFGSTIVYHKLEVVFAALFGVAFLAENPTQVGWAGVVACTAGIVAMNLGRQGGPGSWRRALHFDAGALLALLCAWMLVLATFALKAANAAFLGRNPDLPRGWFEAASHTLFHTTWMEVVLLSAWILAIRAREFGAVRVHWRRMAALGASAFCGSLCWFWAYSLTLVAYVKAVGQVEALFAVFLSLFLFRERALLREIPGMLLVLAGIVLVLLG